VRGLYPNVNRQIRCTIMKEFKENRLNYFSRVAVKSTFVGILAFGIIFFVFSILLEDMLFVMVSTFILVLGCYINISWRVAKIILIRNGLISLKDGKKVVTLKREDISFVMKLVRFTLGERFGFIIRVKKGGSLSPRVYFISNEPQYNFIDSFKKMNVSLKNFP
jgi:hypothetical protein